MNEGSEKLKESQSVDYITIAADTEINKIKFELKAMKKEIAKMKRDSIKTKKALKRGIKIASIHRKKYWQLVLEHSKNQKDIALDGISGGLYQN